MKEDLAEALVDAKIGPDHLLQAVKDVMGAPQRLPAVGRTPEDQETVTPKLWDLSDGTRFKGLKVQALKAEADVAEARVVAASTPEI
jgi:hypothetical protein